MSPSYDLDVVVTRGDATESVHRVAAAVVADDRLIGAARDATLATYWRSCAKPFQIIPFLESGDFDALDWGADQLALACGSHGGEPEHVAIAERMLLDLGLEEGDLACGVTEPLAPRGVRILRECGGRPTRLHNNCSGKHAAMLAVCTVRGWPTATYLDPTHPLQAEIRGHVARAVGLAPHDVPFCVDGCGLPTFFLPVQQLARALQWLQRSGDAAARRVLDAMASHSEMVGGTGNSDTDLPKATGGRLVSKYGALGVVGAVDRRTGAAVAVKLDAGTSQPARALALGVMRDAGLLDAAEATRLTDHLRPPVKNHAGLVLGHVEPRLA